MYWLTACATPEPSPGGAAEPPTPLAPDLGPSEPTTVPATAETGDSATSTSTAGPDPFLSGDPADLVGLVDLVWGTSPDTWSASASTFAPGTLHWTGTLDVPYAGLDTCEVRTGDPRLTSLPRSLGEMTLRSGTVDVPVAGISRGVYVATVDVATVDPRGLAWSIGFSGDAVPGFAMPGAVVVPTGDLVVDAPVEDQAVSRGGPLPVAWSGTPAHHVQLDLIAEDREVWVRCLVVDDGAFEVGAEALAELPPGPLELEVARTNGGGAQAGTTGWWVQVSGRLSVERSVDLL